MAQEPTSSHRKTAHDRSRRWPWILLGIIIVVLVGAFVWKVAGDKSGVTTGTAAGMSVPGISLTSTSDHPIALTDYRGKKLVVYFYEAST